jgi:hypothetical protein
MGDSYVGFYHKRGGASKPVPVAAHRIDELREWLPGIADDVLGADSYMTVNGFFAPCREAFRRQEKWLRALNAVYVDLDVGRRPAEKPDNPASWLGADEADYMVMKLAAANEIPYPSVIARSGRGIYLMWLLVDVKNPDLPPPGFQLDLYKRIQREVNERLTDLAADPAAKDGARILRVPESIHGGTQKRVRYRVQCGDDGRPLTYTLPELAGFFGIEREERKETPARARRPRGKGAKPRKALCGQRIEDIESVAKAIGVLQGNRRVVLTHYAECHRVIETDPRETLNACYRLARLCKPRYPGPGDTPVREIVQNAYGIPAWALYKHCRLRNDTLCRRLRITPDLARRLELQTILPKEERERRKAEPSEAQKRRQERRAFLRDANENGPATDLSTYKLAKLASACGFPCSHMTVSRDLNAMGLRETRGRSGRPRKGRHSETGSLVLRAE